MAFREVWVVQIRELLRRWLAGDGEHTATRTAGVARRTVRNYIAAVIALGVERPASQSKLTDALIGEICEQVRLGGPDGHGESWRARSAEQEQIRTWASQGLTVVKIGILLERMGASVPKRALARFCVERCARADGAPLSALGNLERQGEFVACGDPLVRGPADKLAAGAQSGVPHHRVLAADARCSPPGTTGRTSAPAAHARTARPRRRKGAAGPKWGARPIARTAIGKDHLGERTK